MGLTLQFCVYASDNLGSVQGVLRVFLNHLEQEVISLKIAIVLSASLLILSLCAQAPVVSQSQEPAQSVDTIKISTDIVLVDALVTNQQTGRVIGSLRADDFQLYEDKVKQEITHFSQDRLPLALVMTFDVGGSLPEELLLKKELLAALQGLKPEDEVALMAFDFGRVRLIEDFSRDRELITDRLANIREEFHSRASVPSPTGGRASIGMRPGSALNQAVYEAATLLNQRHQPGLRTAIIVVAPEDQPVQFPFIGKSQKKVLEALLEPGTTVNGLVLPGFLIARLNPMNTALGLVSRGSVSKYAEETGGDLVKVEGSDAGKKLSQAIERLRARYSLGYLPTNEKWDGKYRRISLTVTPEVEKREGKVVIQVRKGYFAKKPTQAATPDPGKKGGKGQDVKPFSKETSARIGSNATRRSDTGN
jgi:VWFA-related protein